jgi:ssDNA-binding Zn-finger/Zn-ribbon topoisomerase 1
MRITGLDKASMDRAIQESLIEKISAVSCPKCHKIATNISMENGKLRFEACCKELRRIIMDKIQQGSL